jgi:hypothetical protein
VARVRGYGASRSAPPKTEKATSARISCSQSSNRWAASYSSCGIAATAASEPASQPSEARMRASLGVQRAASTL